MTKIKQGLIPEEMEDKWFMYYSDSCLHVHRSWTGFTIYIVRFNEQDDGGAVAIDFRANRDPEQYKETKNERDRDAHICHRFVLFWTFSSSSWHRLAG